MYVCIMHVHTYVRIYVHQYMCACMYVCTYRKAHVHKACVKYALASLKVHF